MHVRQAVPGVCHCPQQVCVLAVGPAFREGFLLVHIRSSTPHKITFNLPEELMEHLEVLPRHGVIQANSSFAAQLKFHPKQSIVADCQQYCSTSGGSGEGQVKIPVEITVADLV